MPVRPKLPAHVVAAMRVRRGEPGTTIVGIAQEFGVSRSTVGTYTSLGGAPRAPRRFCRDHAERLLNQGWTYELVGRLFGVSTVAVYNALPGRSTRSRRRREAA